MRRAFTLIELMVVIAMAAVLMALLMPAIGLVKKQAQDAGCRSNLRQLGVAALAYAGDWRGQLPGYDWGPSWVSKAHWPYTLADYIGVEWTYKWWPEAGDRNTQNVKTYRCPADGGSNSPYLNSWQKQGYPITYGAHQLMSTPRTQWEYGANPSWKHWDRYSEASLKKASTGTLQMFLDLTTSRWWVAVNTDWAWRPSGSGQGHLSFRHSGGGTDSSNLTSGHTDRVAERMRTNCVYADGRVDGIALGNYSWDAGGNLDGLR